MYNNDLPTRAELPSSTQLLRSTVIAFVTAAVILVTVVLPAEYGIDPTGVGRMIGLQQMGEIKVSLAEEAERDRAQDAERVDSPPTETVSDRTAPKGAGAAPGKSAVRSDEMSVTLAPGEGTEVKVTMARGATVSYEWSTAGGPVNHNTHADGPGGKSHLYGKASGIERDAGELVAPFDGNHGWFWRNRTEGDVTVTLRTNGEYAELKRVK